MYKISRQHIMVTLSALLFCSAPLLASCCGKKNKCFNSITACSIAAGYLRVVGNEQLDNNLNVGGTASVTGNISGGGTITAVGNISSGGVVSDINGSIGDQLAYGRWYNAAAGNSTYTPGTAINFPTAGPALNVAASAGNTIFTVAVAGTYLVTYTLAFFTPGSPFSVSLQKLTGGPALVAGSGIDLPETDNILNLAFLTASYSFLVTAAAGDQFSLINNSNSATSLGLTNPNPNPNNLAKASITFMRIHG